MLFPSILKDLKQKGDSFRFFVAPIKHRILRAELLCVFKPKIDTEKSLFN